MKELILLLLQKLKEIEINKMSKYVKDIKRKIKNSEFDSEDSLGNSLLLQAIRIGNLSLALKIIKSQKVDISKKAKDETTALFYAIICKNLRLVKALLKYGEEIEPKECSKLGSPLLWASRAGANNIVSFLIKNGANINRQTTPMEYTPLMGACFTLKERTISQLVKLGADISIKNKEELTALNIYKRSGGKNPDIENYFQNKNHLHFF